VRDRAGHRRYGAEDLARFRAAIFQRCRSSKLASVRVDTAPKGAR
jgi:hypothetical protein